MILANRDIRQRDIVPPDRLATCHATVIGVGAIGRQVALQLAAMGVPRIQLIDFDLVEEVNLACQGYAEDDLGKPKVEATAEMCRRLNSQIDIQVIPERFRRSQEIGGTAFLCVDRIETRRTIWDAVRDRTSLFIDGRMAAEVLRVLTVHDQASAQYYPTTLFSAEQAYVGACTARSTIYTANIVAGLMLSQLARWLRRLPVEPDLTINLLTDELSVGVT
jgi:sulfur carrier protein ThiS adenylyltransferase